MNELFSADAWNKIWTFRQVFLQGLGNTALTAFVGLLLALVIGIISGLFATGNSGRQNDLDALGQDNKVHFLDIAKALGVCRLELTLGYRLNPGADYLGHIGAMVDAKSDNSGPDNAEAHSGKGEGIV